MKDKLGNIKFYSTFTFNILFWFYDDLKYKFLCSKIRDLLVDLNRQRYCVLYYYIRYKVYIKQIQIKLS